VADTEGDDDLRDFVLAETSMRSMSAARNE
jgi:hypothetical protein